MPRSWVKFDRLVWLLPCVLVAILYAQVHDHAYIEYDDLLYTSMNPMVSRGLSWSGFLWAFDGSHFSNYHPLTWLSHMADFSLFGSNPGAFALENAAIHAANALLIAILFARLFGSKSIGIAVGVVFAIHPKLVESVAWISQRKTLLCTFFALITMITYLAAARSENPKQRRRLYAASLATFAVSLLAKGMYVSMPAILPILAVVENEWGGGSQRRSHGICGAGLGKQTAPLIPFVVLTAIMSALTFWAQAHGHAVASLETVPIFGRLCNAVFGYTTYLRHFVFPYDLSLFYAQPVEWNLTEVGFAAAMLALITAGLASLHRRIGLTPLLGWLLFLGMLLPVIGIIQVGAQASADRYMYGPIIGLLILAAGLVRSLAPIARSPLMRKIAPAALGLWCALMSVVTYRQVSYWQNSYSITQASMARIGPNAVLLALQATILVQAGYYELAEPLCRQALVLWPNHPSALINLSIAEYHLGRTDEAIRLGELALQAKPDNPAILAHLARMYASAGRLDKARQAIADARRWPEIPDGELNYLREIEREIDATAAAPKSTDGSK